MDYEMNRQKCYYCNNETSIFSGDPGKWPLKLPVDPKSPGSCKVVCTDCVIVRIKFAEHSSKEFNSYVQGLLSLNEENEKTKK